MASKAAAALSTAFTILLAGLVCGAWWYHGHQIEGQILFDKIRHFFSIR